MPQPTDADMDAFAISFLDSIQSQSIAERREFCGFFTQSYLNTLDATAPARGSKASCSSTFPSLFPKVRALYHTHGAYDVGYFNELPSAEDMTTAFAQGLDSYFATPAGRVWKIDPETARATQLCGPGCVQSDAASVPQGEADIQTSYSLPELQERHFGIVPPTIGGGPKAARSQ
jgi:hypothetical protein